MTRYRAGYLCLLVATALVLHQTTAARQQETFGPWSAATNLERTAPFAHATLNTVAQEGCPAISVDDRYLFMATNRGGAATGLDLWVSQRGSASEPWGAPVGLGAPVNTPANEFCPSPMPDGRTLLFVSNKPGGCGGGDIYYTTWLGDYRFSEPVNLGCHINSAGEEASPSLVVVEPSRWQLYFSSTRAGGVLLEPQGEIVGDSDIYVVDVGPAGFLGAPSLVPGVNTTFDDFRPNVRRDGREIVFDSNRPGSQGLDIWTASRATISQPWNAPTNVASVNSAGNETRPYLSSDGTHLYLGSTRSDSEGSADFYVATRVRQGGS
jgi:hypothetical protein